MLGDPLRDLTYDTPNISLDERSTLLQSLCQHDISKMERLEMNAYSVIDFEKADDAQLQLPEQITMQAASLKHLVLAGYGIDWQLCPAFGRSLKAFGIYSVPIDLRTSMAQLLSFVSYLPLLDTLSISGFGFPDEELPSHVIKPVHMKYLRHLTISFITPSHIVSLLKYLTFPKENIIAVKITCMIRSLGKQLTMALEEMTRMVDHVTNRSTLELVLDDKVRCWKARPNRSGPVIELDLMKGTVATSRTMLSNAVLKSLHLDNIVCVEVEKYCAYQWDLILGNLPHIQELKIHSNERATITALSRRLDTGELESQTPTGLHPLAFPALTNLTIEGWKLTRKLIIASQKTSVIQGLLDWIKLRNTGHLSLKRLELKDCRGVTDTVLSDLQEVVVDILVTGDTTEYDDGDDDDNDNDNDNDDDDDDDEEDEEDDDDDQDDDNDTDDDNDDSTYSIDNSD
ncbi:hypothetical protein H0H92_008864 [Tricholoma furcatifolium]|nr:hypothetical protein H0H92_008864 [Tricholoma furcatifolium]